MNCPGTVAVSQFLSFVFLNCHFSDEEVSLGKLTNNKVCMKRREK
jgi:hypothetical protein